MRALYGGLCMPICPIGSPTAGAAPLSPRRAGLEEEPGSPRAASAYGMAVDWWSYGVLLHEMLTGSKPYEAENAEDMLQALQGCPPFMPCPVLSCSALG